MDDQIRDDAAVRSYKDLWVWQRAIDLVIVVYELTRTFPQDERFGLTSQMRRAAVSVPSNIAEGQARQTTQEFRRSLRNALGSLGELETQLIVSRQLGFHTGREDVDALIGEVGRMLHGLHRKLGEDAGAH
jgi:four helix bundle protein